MVLVGRQKIDAVSSTPDQTSLPLQSFDMENILIERWMPDSSFTSPSNATVSDGYDLYYLNVVAKICFNNSKCEFIFNYSSFCRLQCASSSL